MDVVRRSGANCAFITGIITAVGYATLPLQLILLSHLIERFVLDWLERNEKVSPKYAKRQADRVGFGISFRHFFNLGNVW